MNIKYNIAKEQRKALAQKIAEIIGEEAKYLKVPSCAYQIGAFYLNKDVVLTAAEDTDEALINTVLTELEKAGYQAEPEPESLTVTMPRSFFDDQALDNLRHIVENKGSLIRKALGAEELPIEVTDEEVCFPWFTIKRDGESDAYILFISQLCDFAKTLKRVVNRPDTSDNEKYAFRCFLLRLGMIGTEFKQARKVLLRRLTGSSAFRHGRPNEDASDEVPE